MFTSPDGWFFVFMQKYKRFLKIQRLVNLTNTRRMINWK